MKYSEKELVERLCQDHKEAFLNEKNSDIHFARNFIRPFKKSSTRFMHSRDTNTIESISWNNGVLLFKHETIRDSTKQFEKNFNVKTALPLEESKNYYSSVTLTNGKWVRAMAEIKHVSPADCISVEGIVTLSFNPDYGK
jgi:hypothetical protein